MHSTGKADAGFVIRDHWEVLKLAGSIPLGYCLVLEAEAAGVEFGLATALRFGFKNIPVEGDSQVLILRLLQQV